MSSSLTHLKFGLGFKQSITGLIPSSVTHLRLGYYLKYQVDRIPPTVTHLTIGYKFDDMSKSNLWQVIVPKTIKYLTVVNIDSYTWKNYYCFE